jgi:hypothetical protein
MHATHFYLRLPLVDPPKIAETRRGSLDLRHHLFAEDLHLIDQFLHGVRREVEASTKVAL